MGGDEHGHAVVLEVADQREHLADEFRVEGRGDLVEQQQARRVDQRPDDGRALLLAPGEPAGVLAGLLGQADPLEQLPGPRLRRTAGHLVHPPRGQRDVVQHGHVREEVERLEDHADALADPVRVGARVGHVGAVEVDRAVVDGLQQVHATQQCGLA
jgi:hypothetical protein